MQELRKLIEQITDSTLKHNLHEFAEQFIRDKTACTDKTKSSELVHEAIDLLGIIENKTGRNFHFSKHDIRLINKIHKKIASFAVNELH